MATPTYRIYYGKYPDQLTNEIPNDHIKEIDGLQFRMEPGKPGKPKVDEVSFTLENLDHTASEIYPRSWFENASRTEAEGAIVPLQLFFRIEMPDYGNRGFTGVLRNKKYGRYRETVQVTIKDPRDLIKESDVFMLKPFEFDSMELSPNSSNIIGWDLNGDQIHARGLFFSLKTGWADDHTTLSFDHPYADHRDYNNIYQQEAGNITFNDSEPYEVIDIPGGSFTRNTWVKIGEITLFTELREFLRVVKAERYSDNRTVYWLDLGFVVINADNGNLNDPDYGKVLERGRYFKDDEGTPISDGDELNITIYDYNLGFDNDILVDIGDGPFSDARPTSYYHGCEVEKDFPTTGEYTIRESGSWFDTLSTVIEIFENRLYAQYYDSSSNVDLFDVSKVPTAADPDNFRHAFWADLMMYGWLDTEPSDILVNLAMQLGCFIYFNEDGQIVFHPRNYHESYLPGSLPPDAFEVQLSDIEPLGDYEEDHGFDSFKIEVTDRIEINNVESDESWTVHVDENGERNNAALRSTDLTVKNFRSSDLGIPSYYNPVNLPLFRYSPDDPNFLGAINVDELSDFIPTATAQAQNFAASWSYPTVLWKIKWNMPKYPQAGIGKYFWVAWPTENKVYLIRDITHDPDRLLHKIEVQEVGVYTP